MSEDPPSTSERRISGETCMVCLSPQAASPHFGAISCLACAAFFRRTVSLNINFICKQQKKCRIYYELRMICRACRYDKCVLAGMKRECVQKKRPAKNNSLRVKEELPDKEEDEERVADEYGLANIKSELPDTPPTPSQQVLSPDVRFDCAASASSSLDSFECSSTSSPQNQPSTSTANVTPVCNFVDRTYDGRIRARRLHNLTGVQLLKHYCDEERIAMDARRVMYSTAPLVAMVETTGEVPYTREHLTTHTLLRQRGTIQFEHFLSFQYARRLPGFELLSKDEKAHLYKSCALGFSVLDIARMSVKLRHANDQTVIFTDGTYSDLKDLTTGWEDEPGVISKEQKKLLFLDFNERLFTELIVPMYELNLSDEEYAALKALTAWRHWYLQFTNTLQDLAKEHERLILDGLIQFYRRTKQEDFPTRMGSILLLIGTISELYRLVTETFTKIQFFNLLDIDHVSKSLINF